MSDIIERAKTHFNNLIDEQLERIEMMKSQKDWIVYSSLKPIIIGIIAGDGIGLSIAKESEKILRYLLKEEMESGKVELRNIEFIRVFYLT